MFGLIPMVITIILAGLITAAVAYLGGDIFTDSSVRAKANTFINEGSQVRSAAQIFRATKATWPADIAALTDPDPSYLGSTPSNAYLINVDGEVSFTEAAAGAVSLTTDICVKVQEAAGDDTSGAYTLPTAEPTDQLFGCYLATTDNVFFHN
jgi:hypothetical protein